MTTPICPYCHGPVHRDPVLFRSREAHELCGLRSENERLRSALRFYADSSTYEPRPMETLAAWESKTLGELTVFTSPLAPAPILSDRGWRARATLFE